MTGAAEPSDPGTRYVLLTQCLQNDFFLNRECRLSLPDTAVRTMLLGRQHFDHDLGKDSRRHISEDDLKAGPLGRFLEETIGKRRERSEAKCRLDVINIRDWHVSNVAYDGERRRYGSHCECGTWGARYIEGLGHHLDPRGAGDGEEARYFEENAVRIHHVHADSLFDFRPRFERIKDERKYDKSALEVLLDIILQGSHDDLERKMPEKYAAAGWRQELYELARTIDQDETVRCHDRIYVAVIGVYTDLKIKTLLTGLRTRYNVPNIAVSDTLTASASLERHLSGLDFASKVLDIEVVHGINDLVRFTGGAGQVENESEIVADDPFARYQSFFQDQQNVLAYETERLQEYTILTERRSRDVYERVKWANQFLIAWGGAFLTATLVLSIASALTPKVDWQIPAITAGVSLAQFLGAFFTQPTADMQRNLTNLATFRMILESHSLKTAFARFHLTTPQMLRELRTAEEAEAAKRQIGALEQQIAAIQSLDLADFQSLREVGFAVNGAAEAAAAPAVPAPAQNGASPVDLEGTPAPQPSAE